MCEKRAVMMSDKSQEPWTLPDYQKPLQEGVNTPDTAAKYSAASIAAAVEAKYKTWKFQNSARLVFLGASALALLISQDLVVVGYYIIAYFLVTSLVKTFFLARADRNLTSRKDRKDKPRELVIQKCYGHLMSFLNRLAQPQHSSLNPSAKAT